MAKIQERLQRRERLLPFARKSRAVQGTDELLTHFSSHSDKLTVKDVMSLASECRRFDNQYCRRRH